MSTNRVRKLLIALAVSSLWSAQADAATYRVSQAGDDASPGTAQAPWKTLAHAVDTVQPGDLIELAAGQYEFKLPKTTFDGRIVTIRAAGDAAGKVTVTGFRADYNGRYSYLRFEGLDIPQTIRIHKAKWIQFVRCTFTGASHWGVALIECENCGLYGCTVKTDTGSQVMLGGVKKAEYRFNEITDGTSDAFQGSGDDLLIEGNWIHDMRRTPGAHADGLQLGNTRRLILRGNVFDCPDMQTLFFAWTSKEKTYEDIVIENNVCTTAQVHGLTIRPSTDLVVRNNLIVCDPRHKYSTQSIAMAEMKGKAVVQNNILWLFSMPTRAQDVVSHNLMMKKHWKADNRGAQMPLTTAQASFVDWPSRDYRLKDDSPAVAAAAPGGYPATDILGRKRPGQKACIGPIEKLPGDDRPFMDMWKEYFRRMQGGVIPPAPPID